MGLCKGLGQGENKDLPRPYPKLWAEGSQWKP